MRNIVLHEVPTNDAWCRDHGPCFCMARETAQPVIINWGFNSWGGKYPFDLDDRIPAYDASVLGLPLIEPGLILEGGSIDVNGAGSLLTTESCLLNPNRNPSCSRADIESALRRYCGAEQIIWLGEGIAGDDTDGHVDDMTRFVSETKVVTAVEQDPADVNYAPLRHNLEILRSVRLPGGRALDIVELPMPAPVYYAGQRLPASYANFYLCNAAVIMPTFRCARDAEALGILKTCFDRPVIGLDAYDIIQGLGSFHCLSRQQPHGDVGCNRGDILTE
jgi:agmatine deiminase